MRALQPQFCMWSVSGTSSGRDSTTAPVHVSELCRTLAVFTRTGATAKRNLVSSSVVGESVIVSDSGAAATCGLRFWAQTGGRRSRFASLSASFWHHGAKSRLQYWSKLCPGLNAVDWFFSFVTHQDRSSWPSIRSSIQKKLFAAF